MNNSSIISKKMAVNFYTVKKESKEQFENILEKMTGK
jgi:hypothetical protein